MPRSHPTAARRDAETVPVPLAWEVVLTTTQPYAAIEDVFMSVIDDMQLKITAINSPGQDKGPSGETTVSIGEPAALVME